MRSDADTEPHDLQGYAKRERRMAKKLFIIGGGFVGIFVLGILYWNWSAAREWQRLKSDLEAQGESFELGSLLPPAPPENENFAAIATLKDLPLIVDGDDERGEPAERRKALISISAQASAKAGAKPAWKSGAQCGEAADLKPWAEYLRNAGTVSMPPDSGNAAADLLAAIDRALPVVHELEAAAERPTSQFTPALAQRPWPGLLISQRVPHYNAAQNAANTLRLRAVAAVHAGDGAVATRSLLAMSKLSEAVAQEPFLIAHLVSITITSMVHAALWEGLEHRVFSEDQLKAVQSNLQRCDGRSRLLYAARTELVAGVNAVQHLKSNRSKSQPGLGVPGLQNVLRVLPDGWFDQNATDMARSEWEHIIKPLRDDGLQAAVVKSSALNAMLSARRAGFMHDASHMLVNLLVPTLNTVITKSAATQSINDQAVAAVALERYFIRHHKYPATLNDLAPEFLPAPPRDGLNGKPLRYRLTDDGRYVIWTEGFDGFDDDGKVNPDPVTHEVGRNLYRPDYKGDWVWQYTPVKP